MLANPKEFRDPGQGESLGSGKEAALTFYF